MNNYFHKESPFFKNQYYFSVLDIFISSQKQNFIGYPCVIE